MSSRSFTSVVVFSHDVLARWARMSARNSGEAHAFVVTYAAFPNLCKGDCLGGREHIRIAEQTLLEYHPSENAWVILWDSFEFFLRYMKCPIRIELRKGQKGSPNQFRILIPPDTERPRATRWCPLFTGDFDDDVEIFFKKKCAALCDVQTVRPQKSTRNSRRKGGEK